MWPLKPGLALSIGPDTAGVHQVALFPQTLAGLMAVGSQGWLVGCVVESWQGALLTTLGLDLGQVWPLGCPPALLGDLFLCLLFSNHHLAQVLLFPARHPFCPGLVPSPSFPLLLSLCLIFFQFHLSLSPPLPLAAHSSHHLASLLGCHIPPNSCPIHLSVLIHSFFGPSICAVHLSPAPLLGPVTGAPGWPFPDWLGTASSVYSV